MRNYNEIKYEQKHPAIGLLSGVAIGYAITFIVFIGYAILLTYSNVSGKNMEIIIVLTTILSVLVAGFDSAKNAEHRGLLWGVGAGFAYAIILLFVGILVNKSFGLSPHALITLLVSMAGGGLGGVIGINSKKK